MNELNRSIQTAIEGAKPLFDYVRMLLSFYALLALDFFLYKFQPSPTLNFVLRWAHWGGIFFVAGLAILCGMALFRSVNLFIDGWVGGEQNVAKRILKAALFAILAIGAQTLPWVMFVALLVSSAKGP